MESAKSAQERAGRVIDVIAKAFALVGGVVLLAMATVTVMSVIGRALTGIGLGPIRGDYELLANGCALGVFFFLPYCQLKRGHVTVDLFTTLLPARGQAILGLVGDGLITLAAMMILRQLYFSFGEKFPYGSPALRDALGLGYKPFFAPTTFELQIPIWIPHGFALVGATVFLIVSAYTVWRSWTWALAGKEGAL